MTVLAEAVSLRREFDGVVAVDGVDLAVGADEVIGLLGANGAGKTTLIRLLLGLLRPTRGRATLFGEPPSIATRRRVGYVPQTLGLYDDLTVDENWRFTMSVFGVKSPLPSEIRPWSEQIVGALPLGVQRLVAFSVALGHGPELLVLDEPTSGVASLGRARLWEEIRSAATRGAGVLVTTHNLEEAEQCDRLIVMADGRVIARGAVADIVAGRSVALADCDDWRLGFSALDAAGLVVQVQGRLLRVDASVDTVTTVLDQAAVPSRVEAAPANLEEAFVALVADVGRSG